MKKKKAAAKKRTHSPRIVVVVAKFNEFITQALLDGCLDELSKQGIKKSNISVHWVPGSFEIPVVALKAAKKRNVDAVICIGCVIRGETYHFELVANEAARGIMQVSLMTQKPIIMGVLSTDTIQQAYARSEKDGDNKGRDAALNALEMIETLKEV